MAQNTTISVRLFASGYCEAHAKIIDPVDGVGKIKFYAVWALIYVPNIGHVIFDTGYSKEFQLATQHFPEKFYRWTTPVSLTESDSAKSLLEKQHIAVEDIRYVIISHFHADHIAGLNDFPNAQFICTKSAYRQVKELVGIKAVSKGILHKLLPADFHKRTILLEDFADSISENKYGMTEFNVFGVKEFKLILLPGHAKGMLGFIFDNETESMLYATDASWSYNTYSRSVLPSKIVKLFFDSWKDFIETQQKIKAFEMENDQFKILFTHCERTLAYISNEV
jgi:glyoxylase-like metal-dependent hydrolase (beta-lactamase superfamily II)